VAAIFNAIEHLRTLLLLAAVRAHLAHLQDLRALPSVRRAARGLILAQALPLARVAPQVPTDPRQDQAVAIHAPQGTIAHRLLPRQKQALVPLVMIILCACLQYHFFLLCVQRVAMAQ